MQVKSIAECSPLEHSAILLTFIKLPFAIKIFVSSFFEWPFYAGFTVPSKCQTVWIQVRTDKMLGLTLMQTVCKGYRSVDGTSMQGVKSLHVTVSSLKFSVPHLLCYLPLYFANLSVANSKDPNQTAPNGAV